MGDGPGQVPTIVYPDWHRPPVPILDTDSAEEQSAKRLDNVFHGIASAAQAGMLMDARHTTVREAAAPTRTPDAADMIKIKGLLGAFRAAVAVQDATGATQLGLEVVTAIATAYGIELTHVDGQRLLYANELKQDADVAGATKVADLDEKTRALTVGADALVFVRDGELLAHPPAEIAATLVHEVTHANQVALHGAPEAGSQAHAAYEVMAYTTAVTHAAQLGLSPEFLDRNAAARQIYLDRLTADSTKTYVEGEYWAVPRTP